MVIEDGDSEPLECVERVATFTLQGFERLFAPYDMSLEEVHGDYRLSPYNSLTSPRMIVVARKRGNRSGCGPLPRKLLRTRLSVSGDTPRDDASIH
jgi:hypothetical protein